METKINGKDFYLEPEVIINTVASQLKLLPDQVKSIIRKKEWIKGKHIAMYCFRSYTKKSLAEIGLFFNGKDHATVLHATKSVNNQMRFYRTYRNEVKEIMKNLKDRAEEAGDFKGLKNYDTDNA